MDGSKMYSWALTELQKSTGGDLIGNIGADQTVKFSSISTDTRTLKPGALYIAIKGKNFDGHKFIAQAAKLGAVAVLVSEPVDMMILGILVDDTRIALGKFAKWHRLQMPLKKLIAVTGSNGKTTTKCLLQVIFANIGLTLATEGNLNNDFGVPRTLLNLRPEHEYAIIEMGASHLGDIDYLTDLAQPDIAMITNASTTHLEGFGSLQGVIEAKGEIFRGLNGNQNSVASKGVAVINADSIGYHYWLQVNKQLNIKHIVSFGKAERTNVQVTNCLNNEKGIQFNLIYDESVHLIKMPILGLHNAVNAAACVAVALVSGLSWQHILSGLVTFTGVVGRLQKQAIKTGWLIDDSYNANFESVKVGIDALVSLPGDSVLCLGAMAEVGSQSRRVHDEVALYAKHKGVKFLFCYGEDARFMLVAFSKDKNKSYWFKTHQAMVDRVVQLVNQQAAVGKKMNILVKGSRSAKMENISMTLLRQI